MSTLYDLTGIAGQIKEMFDAGVEGEELQAVVEAKLQNDEDLEAKILSYGRLVQSQIAENKAIDDEIKRLVDKKEGNKKLTDHLKKAMIYTMNVAETKVIKDALLTISLRKKPAQVEVYEEFKVPDQFKKNFLEFDPGALDFEDLDTLKEKYGEKVKNTDKISKSTLNKWFKETGEVVTGTMIIENEYSINIK